MTKKSTRQHDLIRIGMNEGDAFETLLDSERWVYICSGESGWFRFYHRTKKIGMTVEYNSAGTVTAVIFG